MRERTLPLGSLPHRPYQSRDRIKDVDGCYYLCLRCQIRTRAPEQKELTSESVVGVDLGVECPVVTSDGQFFSFRSMTPKEAERLRRLERQCARQKKNSCNQKKTRKKIARAHARARRRRADFAEQVSHRLTTDYAGVAYEDLRVQKMTGGCGHSRRAG
jgi:transposase